jgi:hypothetical protein
MERVHLGEVALVLEEGVDRVDLEWEEGGAPNLAQVLAENACVQNVGRLSLMKQEHHATL